MHFLAKFGAGGKAADEFIDSGGISVLRYLFGFASNSRTQQILAYKAADRLPEFEALPDERSLTDRFFTDVGDALRSLWRVRGWGSTSGEMAEVLALLALTPSYPVERFFIGERRIELATEGCLFGELVMRLTRGLSLVSHLRLIGPHPDDGTTELVDNQLLAETIAEYIERLLQFEKLPEAWRAPAMLHETCAVPPVKEFFLWGLAVMLDPQVHDFTRGITASMPVVHERWPTGPEAAMHEYLSLALERVPSLAGGADLIERALRTDWEALGLRSPFQLAESYMQLDIERPRNTFSSPRPTRQRIFSFALPVGAAAIGKLDSALSAGELEACSKLQRRIVLGAMGE